MRSFFSLILLVFPVFLAGCSGAGSDNGNSTNVNNTTVIEYRDANQALADGTKFLDDDEVDKAIAALNQAVKLNPELAEAYFNLGVAYSLVEFRDTLNLENSSDNPSNSSEKKKSNSVTAFEKAAEAYEKVTEREPENHQAFFSLGLSYNKLNKDEFAAKAFRQAVKLNPEDTLYQTELGKILIKLADYREAIGPLKKALELDPENVEAEELLSDAEAGRSRIDYVSPKKDSNSSTSNTSTNSVSSNSSAKTDTIPAQTPAPKPTASGRPPSNRP